MHGFLGPNGSGKTTTIRMLLGLARATRGTMRLFGDGRAAAPARGDRPRIGAVVESPKFSPMFTGRQNLLLLARSIGEPDASVDEALDTVSLTGRDDDRYRGYSLGMKQRLAIAATLLKRPELLILDEPTNGLDPAGIREIRETIRDLGARGVTVLLSSHILAEVQQVCDSATIIGHGRMLASGRVEELIGSEHDVPRRRRRPRRGRPGSWRRPGTPYVVRVASLVVETREPPDRDHPRPRRGTGSTSPSWSPVRADLESVFLQLTEDSTLGHGTDLGAEPAPLTPPRRRSHDEAAPRRADPAALAPGGRCILLACSRGRAGADLGRAWPGAPGRSPRRRSQQAKEQVAQNAESNQASIDECVANPEDFGVPPGEDPEQLCAEFMGGGEDYRWYLTRQPLDVADETPGHRARGDQPPLGPHHAGRHHVRRSRLEQRVDEQPAAVRTTAAPALAGQGRRGLRHRPGGQRRRRSPSGGVRCGCSPGPGTCSPAATSGA